ncbi:hypothetical protein [Sphingomonas pokkalii]|uniref:hypothetical protein n=1 Tax=Sphingomonas pokkalii TaxID=2175090 RepID=UPI0010582C98|nr:hypothetical protein [Sphingomonas pokkalii]
MAFLQKAWPLKLFIPFVRTPTNLVKFAAERSPAAPALWAWSRDFKAGGAKRDLAIARWMVGSAATMMAVEAAQKGLITGGGPSNEKAKNLLIANRWQPYSVKVGNRYVAYGRLDPFSTTIGLAADYVDRGRYMTDKERDRYAETLSDCCDLRPQQHLRFHILSPRQRLQEAGSLNLACLGCRALLLTLGACGSIPLCASQWPSRRTQSFVRRITWRLRTRILARRRASRTCAKLLI